MCLVQNATEVTRSMEPYFVTIGELLTDSFVICLLTEGAIQKSQSCSQEEVCKLNKENAKRESSVLLRMDPSKCHNEGPEEKGESLAFESYSKCRRSSVQKSFTTEKQQEEDVDACERITEQEVECESPADGERTEEHQVSGAEKQEKKEKEGEKNADKSEKDAEEPPAPSQNEYKAGQSDDEEVPEGR